MPPGVARRPRCRLRRRHRLRATTTTRHCGVVAGIARTPIRGPDRAREQHGRLRRRPLPLRPNTASSRPRRDHRCSSTLVSSSPTVPNVRRELISRAGRRRTTPADPRNVYAATKLHQEHLCAAYGREHDAPSHLAAIPQRVRAAHAASTRRTQEWRRSFAVRSSARIARVFEDGASDATSCMSPMSHAPTSRRCSPTDRSLAPFNIASGEPHTVLELADALSRAAGPDAPERRDHGRVPTGRCSPHRRVSGTSCRTTGFRGGDSIREGRP